METIYKTEVLSKKVEIKIESQPTDYLFDLAQKINEKKQKDVFLKKVSKVPN